MTRIIALLLLSLSLISCTTLNTKTIPPKRQSTYVTANLQQGKRYFDDGYYKKALRILLPLACDGSAEAQYAVGYMYYYGLGVAQDTYVGYFWIERSANQHYYPAMQAQHMIDIGINSKA